MAGAPATLVHAAGGAARPQSVASAGALGLMAIALIGFQGLMFYLAYGTERAA